MATEKELRAIATKGHKVEENRFLIEAIPEPVRSALVEDGYGFCLMRSNDGRLRVAKMEIIPDSEFYHQVRFATEAELVQWYNDKGFLCHQLDEAFKLLRESR